MKIIIILSFLFASCTSAVRFNTFENPNRSSEKKKVEEEFNKTHNNNSLATISNNDLLKTAKSYLGTPYKYGGDSKKGIDCSAFVQNVFKDIGINLPRTSKEQYKVSSKNRVSTKQMGDLVFFKKGRDVSHVGIYIGNNQIIHASTSKGVIIQSLDNTFLKKRYFTSCRVNSYLQ